MEAGVEFLPPLPQELPLPPLLIRAVLDPGGSAASKGGGAS
ncbi:hypothetical protein GXM_04077 [Nostoc sphaeroides CCNUC1]|uniref:Uncharacterized protein n=1 Tax=Nostoc sphaeroides CCNUC1 TaxID=2653204 RepID=A0A5P8W2V4_9NOSO|nr:hypothetical protein GXM_04077 [Nostoc sphaeroides CCNUC1]